MSENFHRSAQLPTCAQFIALPPTFNELASSCDRKTLRLAIPRYLALPNTPDLIGFAVRAERQPTVSLLDFPDGLKTERHGFINCS